MRAASGFGSLMASATVSELFVSHCGPTLKENEHESPVLSQLPLDLLFFLATGADIERHVNSA